MRRAFLRLPTPGDSDSPAQVESIGEIWIGFSPGGLEHSTGEAERLETGQPAAFGLIGVDWENFRIASPRMGDAIGAAAKAALAPAVPNFDHQGRLGRNGGMQAVRWLPGLE